MAKKPKVETLCLGRHTFEGCQIKFLSPDPCKIRFCPNCRRAKDKAERLMPGAHRNPNMWPEFSKMEQLLTGVGND